MARGCLLVAAALTAAAVPPNPAAQARAGAAGLVFQREIAPFPVVAADGRAHALPFVGGLDAPRPQFVDIDGDGDLDLFLQEYPGHLWFFENTGSPAAPRYEWRTNRYQGITIGEWYRFVDVDQDGLIDLLCEEPFSFIRFHRNTGSKTAARFEDAGLLRDSDGDPIFMDRQNIPWLIDLDCDRHLDLFVGRVEGTLARYEATAPGSTYFDFITENFEGIEIIGRVGEARPTARHGANAIAFGDFDGDGDYDLFWGDFFEPGILLIENIGRTCSTPSFDVEPVLLPWAAEQLTSGYNAPMPVDFTGNGRLDFFMGVLGGAYNPVGTSADNFFYWERTADDAFALRTRRFLDMIDLGSETIPAVGDLNGDGLPDLIVGSKIDPVAADAGRLTTFLNEGTATAPRFRQTTSISMAGAYHLAPVLADFDGDGDLDLLLGTWNQDVLYFRNDGSRTAPRWVQDEALTIALPRASNSVPAVADIDGDGDLDVFIGGANGVVAFVRNAGTPTAPVWELVTDRLDNVKAGRRSAPTLLDLDGDGLLDLVIGQESGDALAYRNTGTRLVPRFELVPGFTLDLPPASSPRFADLTGDGRLDVISGSVSGGLVFLRGR